MTQSTDASSGAHDSGASSDRLSARSVAAALVALTVLVGSLPAGTLVGAASAQTSSAPVAVFADSSGTLTTLAADGSTSSLGASAVAVGPMAELDGDGRLEAPFVNGDGDVRLVDAAGETQTLATGAADHSKTRIAVGTWNGSAVSVFYVGSDDYIYRVAPGQDPVRVSETAKASAVAGIADVDGDDRDELVYVGTSQGVRYVDDGGATVKVGVGVATNNGVGVGAPHDFDGDGVARVPIVDGSNNVALVAADGTKTLLNKSAVSAAKSPVAAVDWRGDDAPEVLYKTKSDALAYVAVDGSQGLVEGADGSSIAVGGEVSVASVHHTPPAVSAYAVTNPEGREVRVAFNSSEKLSEVGVSISGAESATLTLSNFSVSGSGPYHYVGTYTGSVDGDYTATLDSAVGDDGLDGASGESETVSVQTPTPTITDASLVDVTDGDGVVTVDDSVRISVEVDASAKVTEVTANLSSLGVGTVSLTRSDGVWVEDVPVADDATQGNVTVTVRATNEYDHSDTAESDSVRVDTEPPAVEAGPNRTVDEDTRVTFSVDATDATELSYEWSLGDGTTATGESVTHSFADPGTYTVTVTATDAAGNAATDSVTVAVDDTAEESISVDAGSNRTVDEDTQVTFNASSQGLENVTYVWSFGDGDTATGESVTHAFADPGTYTVTVTARNESGVVASDSLTVSVRDVESDGALRVADVTVSPATVTAGETVDSQQFTVTWANVSADGDSDTFFVAFPDELAGNVSVNGASTNVSGGLAQSAELVDGPDDDGVVETVRFQVNSGQGGGTVDLSTTVDISVHYPAGSANATFAVDAVARDSDGHWINDDAVAEVDVESGGDGTPTVEDVTENGVSTAELKSVISLWVAGDISTDGLQTIITHWVLSG